MNEANQIIHAARKLGLKLLSGCMSETSCAISAAAQLSAGLDFIDLDGAMLILNDCFDGAKLRKGKIIAENLPGIGAIPTQKLNFGR